MTFWADARDYVAGQWRTPRRVFGIDIFLLLILALGFVLRLHHLNQPPVDYQEWRQTQTLMIARNFCNHGMNLLYPRLDWRTFDAVDPHGYVGATELQVVPFLTAIIYKLFGASNWAARVFPIFFSLLGLVYFFRLAEAWCGRLCGLIASLLLAVSPMYLYFGRVQMPESFSFAMTFAALYYVHLWVRADLKKYFVHAWAACLLMLLAKPQNIYAAIPMAYMVLKQFGARSALKPRLYVFLVLLGVPLAAYVWHSYVVLARTGISFAPSLMDTLNFHLLTHARYYQNVLGSVWRLAVGPAAVILGLAGLAFSVFRRCGGYPHALLAGAIVSLFLMPGFQQPNAYYQMFFAPPACLFSAILLDAMTKRRFAWIGAAGIAAGVSAASLSIAFTFFEPSAMAQYKCGQWIRENTPRDALILTGGDSPATLYFCDRVGWTCWRDRDDKKVQLTPELVHRVQSLGGSVVAIPLGMYLDDAFNPVFAKKYWILRDFLYENYQCYRGDDFAVFFTDKKAELGLPDDGLIVLGRFETRKYLRGDWGKNRTMKSGDPYVVMGPGKRASIRFDETRALKSVKLTVSSAVDDQTFTVVLDDGPPHEFHMAKSWARSVIVVPVTENAGPQHKLKIEVEKQSQNHAGLALFLVDVETR